MSANMACSNTELDTNQDSLSKAKRPRRLAVIALAAVRGLALFLGIYAALSLLTAFAGGNYNANAWWIDMSHIPSIISWFLQLCLTATLIAFTFKVPRLLFWRLSATLLFICFALIALQNALLVYALADQGSIKLGFSLPFSLFIMAAFLALALAVFFGYRVMSKTLSTRQKQPRWATALVIILSLCLSGIAFPLGQTVCFGMTDYRQEVDAVVIFGAQVYPSGRLSQALAGRVDKGIELYQQGYTPVLIMSGGTGVEGINEAEAMRQYAIDRGVPAQAIIIDPSGNSTELTVAHTLVIAEQYGFHHLAAVSSFYHMPRIKMFFLSSGSDVLTVPADLTSEGSSALFTTFREVPGWWFYWFKQVFIGSFSQ